MNSYQIAILPGDGIGPEVTAQAVSVLRRATARSECDIELREARVGQAAIEAEGAAISEATMALCQQSDAILFGAVGGTRPGDPHDPSQPEHAIYRLRQELGLFANLRPVRSHRELAHAVPLRRETTQGVDLVVVRELTGGLYYGAPSAIRESADGASAVDTMVYSEGEIERVVRYAFELARTRRRHHLTSVDKANVLSCSRLWRRVADRVAGAYPDVQLTHMLVDTCAMALMRQPRQFDVIVTENLFGDILTDEASVLSGSMGMVPSASLGTRRTRGGYFGLYEPIHGSAPDIAGKARANPIGAILSVALLLRHSLGLRREAQAVERAVRRVIAMRYGTFDLAGPGIEQLTTRQMGTMVGQVLDGTFSPSSPAAKARARARG